MQTKLARLAVPVLMLGVLLFVATQGGRSDETPPTTANEEPQPTAMTVERLGELVLAIDAEASLEGTAWILSVEGLDAFVAYDIAADRMRIMIPIVDADEIDEDRLRRLMQANFDSALDARYAIAQGTLWGTFIHPLSALRDDEFLSGMGQTVNVVTSYGTSYTSGMFIFGSGDSAEIERRELIERLKELDT